MRVGMTDITRDPCAPTVSDTELFHIIGELCSPGDVLSPKLLAYYGAGEDQSERMLGFLLRHGATYIGSLGLRKDKHVIRHRGAFGQPEEGTETFAELVELLELGRE